MRSSKLKTHEAAESTVKALTAGILGFDDFIKTVCCEAAYYGHLSKRCRECYTEKLVEELKRATHTLFAGPSAKGAHIIFYSLGAIDE